MVAVAGPASPTGTSRPVACSPCLPLTCAKRSLQAAPKAPLSVARGLRKVPAGPAVPGKKGSARGSEPWYPVASRSGKLGSPDAPGSLYAQVAA